jgi:hypothetical protein
MTSEIATGDPEREPTRQEIDQMQGAVLLDFGAEW